MYKKLSISILACLLAVFSALPAFAASVQSQIENSLVCPACLDEGMTVATCGDGTAAQTRIDIGKKLSQGMTKDQIIQAYIDQYGSQILAVPTKSGFNLTAWVTPFIALFAAAYFVHFVLKRWTRNNAVAEQADSALADDAEYDDLLEDEIKKYLR